MIRLWLDYQDLTRIRIASGMSPIAATVLSAQALQEANPLLHAWRSRTRARLTGPARLVLDLTAPGRWIPDFLTPYVRGPQLDSELDLVAAASPKRMRAELELSCGPHAPSWLTRLASGDPETRDLLLRALRDFHQTALADLWPDLNAHQRAEAAHHAQTLAANGLDDLLGNLHPAIRWTPPVLELDAPRDGEIHLQGRGLFLIPSLFVTGPRFVVGDGPGMLVFPATSPFTTRAPDALAKVFGRTRAAALQMLDAEGPLTTGALAAQLDVSAAAASQHATALREAALITSRRTGKTVHHTLTPLGRQHLHG